MVLAQLEDVPGPQVLGYMLAAGRDKRVEMGIVLAEDEKVGGGRAGDIGD